MLAVRGEFKMPDQLLPEDFAWHVTGVKFPRRFLALPELRCCLSTRFTERRGFCRKRARTQLAKARKNTKPLFVDHHGGQPIQGETGVRVWFAERSQRWNRMGFLLMTAGFLCDLVGKW